MLKIAVPFDPTSRVATVPVPTSGAVCVADVISLGTGSPGVTRQ